MLNSNTLKPFVSVFIIVATMLSVVFVKMETRRMGYVVLKKTRIEKNIKDQNRIMDLELARLTRSARLEQLALKKLDLKKASRGQIVQLFFDKEGNATPISRVQ